MSSLAVGHNLKQTLYERVFEKNQLPTEPGEESFNAKGKRMFEESAFRYFVEVPSLSKPSLSKSSLFFIIEIITSLWKSFISYFRSFVYSSCSCISVKNEDTFDAANDATNDAANDAANDVAKKEVELGRKVLVLNFASTEEPGGGFNEGKKGGQEEDLCRRSDLGAMMFYIKGKQLESPEVWNLNFKIVHTPSVRVFRASERKKYERLEKPFNVGILSCGALPMPSLNNGRYAHADREEMKKRIYSQLFIAKQEGYETLILGAFGCGAFGNPPEEVAELYRSIIQNYFSRSFKNITFAILNDPNRAHNSFEIFQRVLG